MKKITSLLFTSLLCYAVLANGGVNFVKNMTWAQVKAKATKEKKMIFFDAYTTWCGPCKYLEQSVYTDASVADFFNAHFINVKFDMEEGEGLELAEAFGITAYPTLLFMSPDGKPVHKFIGALHAGDFLHLGKDAIDPAKQYFTLKLKVVTQQATTEDFMKWSALADDLEDNTRGTVASNWLAGQPDILGTPELAKATMLSTDVNEVQLTYLYQQKNKIRELLGWDPEKTEAALYRKLFNQALKKVDDTKRDKTDFIALISKYDASLLYYALTDLELMLVIGRDKDHQKGMEILAGSIRGANSISLPQFCVLLIEHSPRFEKSDIERLNQALNNYSFTAGDTGLEWGFYLAQVICNSRLENLSKAKEFAEKAYQHPRLPESYKPVLKESFQL